MDTIRRQPTQFPISGWFKRIQLARLLRVNTKSIGRWHKLGLIEKKVGVGTEPGRKSVYYSIIDNEVYERAGGLAAQWLKASRRDLEERAETLQVDYEEWARDRELVKAVRHGERSSQVRAELNPHTVDEHGLVEESTPNGWPNAPVKPTYLGKPIDPQTAAVVALLRELPKLFKG
jgi:hypothetical protein